jgi:hypothetical protein
MAGPLVGRVAVEGTVEGGKIDMGSPDEARVQRVIPTTLAVVSKSKRY